VKSDAVFVNSDYFANVDLTRAGLDQPNGADTLYAGEGNDVLHIATDDVAFGGVVRMNLTFTSANLYLANPFH
jgi:hypothetical protein